jgi:hypothetical protein
MVAYDVTRRWVPRFMSGLTTGVVTIDKRLLPKYGPLWNDPTVRSEIIAQGIA